MKPTDFYFWQLVAFTLWWVLIFLVTRKHLFSWSAVRGSALTRPKFIPVRFLLLLHKDWIRSALYCSVPLGLLVGIQLGDSSVWIRLVIACVISLYHLTETSSTHRHGEFPVLYTSWVCCLLPPLYSQAAAHGIVVHFVLSTGIAKLWVGGIAWIRPNTMKTYLSIYHNSSSAKPLSQALNRFIVKHDWLCTVLAIMTLFIECVLVPLTLVVPYPWRLCGCWAMVLMHIGIATTMSLTVGLAFLTVLPSYAYGFSSSCSLASPEHLFAVLVGLGPSLVCVLWQKSLLPEHWPLCPIALFMFNGGQASVLATHLMTGHTRVVLGSSQAISGLEDIVGVSVVHHGALVDSLPADNKCQRERAQGVVVLHDAVLRVIGFTLLQDSLLQAIPPNASPQDWEIRSFLNCVESWLETEQRMVERHTGDLLSKAYFVRIDVKRNVVQEVLMDTKKKH